MDLVNIVNLPLILAAHTTKRDIVKEAVNEWFGATSVSAPHMITDGVVYVFGTSGTLVYRRRKDASLAFIREEKTGNVMEWLSVRAEKRQVLVAAAAYDNGQEILSRWAEHYDVKLKGYGMHLGVEKGEAAKKVGGD